ncbi:hypothetical protein F2Q69_00022024 [Brassica cretica]|uniref:Uncharacterized protein n=1 Tax=Brassica cretica TaxID=69181 RepID=A0A8S9QG76_BRACR|nr:hypothetical protein F2Q69_00022024 [Brassica cretica]
MLMSPVPNTTWTNARHTVFPYSRPVTELSRFKPTSIHLQSDLSFSVIEFTDLTSIDASTSTVSFEVFLRPRLLNRSSWSYVEPLCGSSTCLVNHSRAETSCQAWFKMASASIAMALGDPLR